MAEHFVVEFLEGEIFAFLFLIVVAEFEDFKFANGVIKIFGIVSTAHCFLMRGFFFVIAIFLEEFCGFIDGHALAMHFDGDAQAADAEEGFVGLGEKVLGGTNGALTPDPSPI